MRRLQRPAGTGFTVLEVLVAAMILVLGIVATTALLLAATTQGTVSKRATDAAALAQRELEGLRDLPYAGIPPGTVVTTQAVGAHTYTVERMVTENDPAPKMKRIRVTVIWNIRGPRSYVAETIFTGLKE